MFTVRYFGFRILDGLTIFHSADCICGEFIVRDTSTLCIDLRISQLQLAIDKNMATLARRETDGAIIIRSQDGDVGKAAVFKLNAVSGEPILLERCEE